MTLENVNKIYFAAQSTPGSYAYVNHTFHMAKALKLQGFNPILLVEEDPDYSVDTPINGIFSFNSIPYVFVGKYSSAGSNIFSKIGILFGFNQPSVRFLKQQKSIPFAVILQAPSLSLYFQVRLWCRKNNVQLILETMEWHERSFYRRQFIKWLEAEFRMRVIQRLHTRIIVISRYLENYYMRCDKMVYRLPPLLDTHDPLWMPRNIERNDSVLKLIFSGSTSRDRQDIILGGLLRAKSEGLRVVMEYVGSTRKQMESMLSNQHLLDALGSSVVFHGLIPFEEVPDLLAQADYAVLLRDDARWSRACFPSKIPEFLSLGIPIICNLTSDLGEYICDGREAFVVNELTVDAFTEVIHRAFFVKGDIRMQMSVLARKKAEECFDIHCFAKPLNNFIRQV